MRFPTLMFNAAALLRRRLPRSWNLPRTLACPVGLMMAGLLLPLGAAAAESIDSVEKAATEWVRVRAETARLQTDWASQRELLESAASALKERAQAAEEHRDSLRAKTAKDRGEIEAAQRNIQTASAGIQTATDHLREVRDRLVQLRPSLPPRLSEALEFAYRSLATADLGPSERMQATMTVINRCVQFNRMVTTCDEVLTLEGAPGPKSYEVIYWGLSHGYALDRIAGKVWLGSPGPAGWRWEAHPEAVASVVALIAVSKDKVEPEFVPVPARLVHAFSPSANP